MLRSVVLQLVHLAPNKISSLLIWCSAHSSIPPFIFEWIHLAECYCQNQPNVGVGIPPSSTPVPPLSCLLWHGPLLIPTRTLPTMTSCLCVRGGFSESSQPLLRSAASLCAPALSGCCWDVFWRKGCKGQQGPTSIAATEPDMNDKWRRRLRGGGGTRHRNVLQSAALRTGSLQRHFCTFLDLPTV